MKQIEKPSNATKQAAEKPHDAIESIVQAEHSNPFEILGPHWVGQGAGRSLAIRAFRPGAQKAAVLWGPGRKLYPATQIHPEGMFEVILPADTPNLREGEPIPPTAYRLQFRFANTAKFETYDPYAFPPVLTEYDLYLSGEGTHYEKYEKLGTKGSRSLGLQSEALSGNTDSSRGDV